MPTLQPTLLDVTRRIEERSAATRSAYLQRIDAARTEQRTRARHSCTNLAHAVAAIPANDKLVLHAETAPNLAIVTSYNDMLSAHQPFETYPNGVVAIQS